MGAAIEARGDCDGTASRRFAKRSRDVGRSRRRLALAEIHDGRRRSPASACGSSRTDAALQRRGADALIDCKTLHRARKPTDEQRAALAEIVETGPIAAIHGVERRRRRDLAQRLWDEFRASLDEATVERELRRIGYARPSARPRRDARKDRAVEEFERTSPRG